MTLRSNKELRCESGHYSFSFYFLVCGGMYLLNVFKGTFSHSVQFNVSNGRRTVVLCNEHTISLHAIQIPTLHGDDKFGKRIQYCLARIAHIREVVQKILCDSWSQGRKRDRYWRKHIHRVERSKRKNRRRRERDREVCKEDCRRIFHGLLHCFDDWDNDDNQENRYSETNDEAHLHVFPPHVLPHFIRPPPETLS